MDFGSPDTWRWVWLVFAIVFTVGELSVAGSFFLAPFAAGALAAALVAFAGMSVTVEAAVFVGVSGLAFAGLRPLVRRLDATTKSSSVGAHRWVSREATVLTPIGPGPGAMGTVRLDREEWRAESLTGDAIPVGTPVLVTRVDGTRLVVVPSGDPPPALSSEGAD
jgi:membrane protein implicated in regulation of membrane protease activity